MRKTIKIIDLLNKIANGDEVPKKIKYEDEIFQFTGYNSPSKNYNNELEDLFEILDGSMLNDEVEIIEEDKEENEIPNINLDNMKNIGVKVGKAYRELFEGLNKGWNTPLEEDKKIEKIKYYDDSIAWVIDGAGQLSDIDKIEINKINEIIDKLNKEE